MTKTSCLSCGLDLDPSRTGQRCPHCGHAGIGPPGHGSESDSPATEFVPPHPSGDVTFAESPPTAQWEGAGSASVSQHDHADDDRGIGSLLTPARGLDELGWLGPYRILRVLGVGGMGVVFEAQDPGLGRVVALKGMLPAVAANETNRRRFMQEARATAAIRHENIVTVHNVGEDKGRPYLVMEFLEGESLHDRLEREACLPLDELLRIGLETAEGLDAAHGCGLVHRDIKPANIWLERIRGRVKILDFGLARSTTEDAHLTLSGTIMGTPAYMAPEQARGQPVDARTDLFSLGAVLYRMATGKIPFDGTDTLSILTALALETPRPLYESRSDAPRSLENLVMALLAKKPDDRPTSARAVCDSLRAIQLDQSGGDVLAFDPTNLLLDGEEPEELEVAEEEPEELEVVEEEPESVVAPRLPLDRMDELVGHTLGRYALREVLGRGHHGVVFRAQDRDTGEVVALKVLSPTFPHDDKEIQRFGQIMTTWLTLRHPNLVGVQNAGRTGSYCWIALDLVQGESLDQIIQRVGTSAGRDWKRAVRAGIHLGRALQFTNERRLIHGNVNPRNVLFRSADETFALNDAMFSKVLQKSVLHRDALDGKVEAEAAYLSPEQLDGGTSFVDHLCDLYSLGVVLYALVAGEPPYRGETIEETFELIRAGIPVQPRKYQKSIPREFERAILKMLARNQEDRYQNFGELLADLNRVAVTNRIPT